MFQALKTLTVVGIMLVPVVNVLRVKTGHGAMVTALGNMGNASTNQVVFVPQ